MVNRSDIQKVGAKNDQGTLREMISRGGNR
jgi:hypothetical protein